jgi:hypothetical protein
MDHAYSAMTKEAAVRKQPPCRAITPALTVASL